MSDAPIATIYEVTEEHDNVAEWTLIVYRALAQLARKRGNPSVDDVKDATGLAEGQIYHAYQIIARVLK